MSSTTKPADIKKVKRRLEKKVRTKEQRYKETGLAFYLRERDDAQDELNDLLDRDKLVTKKLQKKAKQKKTSETTSENQAFQEAAKYNRSVRQEALRDQEQAMIKREELKGRRAVAREKLVKKMEDKGQKTLSFKERDADSDKKKKSWVIYRSLYQREHSKGHPDETLKLGEIDRLAKKNYDQEINIDQQENAIKKYEEEFMKRRNAVQSIIDKTEMSCEDKSKTICKMNAHLEEQIKGVRDEYPTVLKVLDEWVTLIGGDEPEDSVELVEDLEEPIEE